MRELTLRQIEVIRAVMLTGTISGADALLNVSAPGTSRLVRHVEAIGQGAIEGLVAPESANNAAVDGALMPVPTLGVAGDAVTAVMVGALSVHGLNAGPMPMVDQPEMFWFIVGALTLANIFMLLFGPTGVRVLKIVEMPRTALVALTMLLSIVGAFAVNNSITEVYRMLGSDRLVPRDLGQEFEEVFAACAESGYRGINVTYPYKERVVPLLRVPDPLVRAIGAVNTVLFEPGGPQGFNTDHSGFKFAYAGGRGATPPGTTLMIGAGGVGRAVAFALAALGATEIRIVDREKGKARALCADLGRFAPGLIAVPGTAAVAAAAGAAGLVNCTPVGMAGHEGTPLPRGAMKGAAWAFDAVYTPADTRFLRDAKAQGLAAISGYDLFIGQGVDAWELFTGLPLDLERLRADLFDSEDAS